jgi:ubiquinone/menaquinone biosynthesis C-methylase UbiE
MGVYHVHCRELKRKHFDSMRSHVSADPELRKKGVIRILEIGAASGYNFEFYPAGSELTVVEVNPFFEKQFFDKQKDHPHIVMKRFVVGFAEDMKEVENNSIDIVVSTMVLCSVRSIQKTLNEVQRVLAPVNTSFICFKFKAIQYNSIKKGGKYYYWEHIREREIWWILFCQHLFSYTFYDLVFGCQLNRKSDEVIQNYKGFAKIEQQHFRTPLCTGVWSFHSSHVKGIATK